MPARRFSRADYVSSARRSAGKSSAPAGCFVWQTRQDWPSTSAKTHSPAYLVPYSTTKRSPAIPWQGAAVSKSFPASLWLWACITPPLFAGDPKCWFLFPAQRLSARLLVSAAKFPEPLPPYPHTAQAVHKDSRVALKCPQKHKQPLPCRKARERLLRRVVPYCETAHLWFSSRS